MENDKITQKSRKLIVCFDGTGNEIEKHESNILRLYKCLKHDETQLVYYEPGVGTSPTRPFASGSIFSGVRRILGLIAGHGLEANVLHAYEFLCRNHQDGDQLYFFGYSRGAYTARMLAGFINDFGLVAPHELHLIGPVFKAYRRMRQGGPREQFADLRIAERFFHVRRVPIRFLGLWDTVSSLIRLFQGRAGGGMIEFGTHSSVDVNPSVRAVRHALSIDETRRFFRPQHWPDGDTYHGTRFRSKDTPPLQDVKQVWFPGTHTDIAGSVLEQEAGLTKISMRWMREELDALGPDSLEFRDLYYKRYVLGHEDAVTERMQINISRPNPLAPMHSQMKKGWFLLEWVPRRCSHSSWPDQKGLFGYYLPLGQSRYVEPGSNVHASAQTRRDDHKPPYNPPLP